MNCFLLQAKGRCLKIALCTVMIKHLFVRVTCLALSQELKTNCSFMQIGKQKLIRPLNFNCKFSFEIFSTCAINCQGFLTTWVAKIEMAQVPRVNIILIYFTIESQPTLNQTHQ
jgi:hypothetical protein